MLADAVSENPLSPIHSKSNLPLLVATVKNEKNPQPNLGNFYLTPRAGRAQVSTRVRLADSQKIIAIAKLSDGSFWSTTTEVVVTLAACTEEVM